MRRRPERGRERPRAAGRPARLSSERIVEHACALVRERGLDALTMRAVADALGATPMALYHHVQDRDALVLLVVDRVIASVELPSEELEPVPWLREIARRLREVGLEHAGVMDVLLDEGPVAPSALRILDRTVAKLHDAGLGWAEATDVHNAFFSWLAATIRREGRWRRRDDAPRFIAVAKTLPRREFPALHRALPRLRESDLDVLFATSLELALSAVERALERQDARR